MGVADERLWLVYDGDSAAGKGIVSKINAPDPYWLGRAPPGAVCPHQHSMEFCSTFESANLLRAVQAREAAGRGGEGRMVFRASLCCSAVGCR